MYSWIRCCAQSALRSRVCKEDRPQRERYELDVAGGGEERLDLCDGLGVRPKRGVREAAERAGLLAPEPRNRQLRRNRGGGIDLEFDLAKAVGERCHLFGEEQAAL